MRIDCKHVWEHISAYIDGEVDAALRAKIDRHLETCEICSAVLDSTRNVVVLVADDRVSSCPPASASGCTRGFRENWSFRNSRSCSSGGRKCRCGNGMRVRRRPRPMDHRMGPGLQTNQNQRHNRQRDLKPLRTPLLPCWLSADAIAPRVCARRCQIHAITARFTTAPIVAKINIGMRIAS